MKLIKNLNLKLPNSEIRFDMLFTISLRYFLFFTTKLRVAIANGEEEKEGGGGRGGEGMKKGMGRSWRENAKDVWNPNQHNLMYLYPKINSSICDFEGILVGKDLNPSYLFF